MSLGTTPRPPDAETFAAEPDRTREKNRAEKLLESAVVRLSSVLTGLHGVTGRDIMRRLIAGERDPRVLAQLARGKITELEHAVEGAEFFTERHARC